jgi:O-antigen/teichoic acid export membrane protein
MRDQRAELGEGVATGPADGDGAEPVQPQPHVRGAATAFTDIVSVSAARAVSIGLALLSITIVTHMLRPGQYAILAYIAVISGLMFATTASWMATGVGRYGREELERAGSVRAASWARIVVTAPLAAVATSVIVLLKLGGVLPRDLTWGFVAIAVASGLVLIGGDHLILLLETCGRMKLTAIALALQRVLSIVGLVVLIVVGATRSPAAIALIWLALGGLFMVALATRVWRVGIWPAAIDVQLLRRMVAFSLPMIAFAASQYVIQAVDVVILGAYRPSRDVGLYAIAYQGYGALQQVATTATIVLSPLFISLRVASQERVIEPFYDRIVPQVLFLTAIGAGLAAPLLRVIVPLVFGHPFAPAARPLAILLLAWALYAAASFVAPILVLHERSRAMGAISSVAAVTNVTGDWLLVGVFGVGIVGPAIVTAASLVVIAVGYFYVAADCLDHRRTLPIAMMAPAAAGVAVALVFDGGLGVAAGVAATLGTAAIAFLFKRPFAAADVELIGNLDIPEPFKRLTLRALTRLG